MSPAWLQRSPPLRWLFGLRLMKFGTVGASGVVVNLAALFVGREYLLAWVASDKLRLDLALGLAILLATVNNFTWNRLWTWRDRSGAAGGRLLTQFAQYASACWLGILMQFLLSRWLATHIHYLVASLVAIAASSIFNFLLNDRWTFRHARRAVPDDLPRKD
jgi:putative flippase GtrA